MPVSKRGGPPQVMPLVDGPEPEPAPPPQAPPPGPSKLAQAVLEQLTLREEQAQIEEEEDLPKLTLDEMEAVKDDTGFYMSGVRKVVDWRPIFLAEICSGASIRRAAIVAGVREVIPYRRRTTDKEFADAWREMANIHTQLLEEEAARRAYHGTLQPVFYKGKRCGYVRKHSDLLLMFLLKKRDPSYRDANNITVNNNTANVFNDISAIEHNIKLISGEVDPAPDGGVPADGVAEPLDARQPSDPQEE